jgi:hypothetical protein
VFRVSSRGPALGRMALADAIFKVSRPDPLAALDATQTFELHAVIEPG